MRRSGPRVRCLAALVAAALAGTTAALTAQLAEHPSIGATTHPAIAYATGPTSDIVAALAAQVGDGRLQITFDQRTGYLKPVLDALRVPTESQILVMSKTGVQGLHTGPENPRAIYFNDAVTVGYIRGAPLLEIAVQDPHQGVLFYTIDQRPQASPVIERRHGCLSCHQAFSTLHVPGLMMRSVFIAPDGLPLGQFGSYDTDHRTLFRQRWGGWYVTGTHGAMRHLGNAIVTDVAAGRDAIVTDRTLNRTSLDSAFDASGYLSAQSDIVALMVFQHQVRMTNLITRIGWDARLAAHDHRLDVKSGALADGIDELVDYLLFVDEVPLTSPIRGSSGFAERFVALGPSDAKGRSLRQLDLDRRLLRYPCSYMIYSAAFRGLHDDVRHAIYARVWEILSGKDAHEKYARLAADDRRAVIEILRETIHDLPPDFSPTGGVEQARRLHVPD